MYMLLKSNMLSSYFIFQIPYLSPLHGTIYMRLKCLMEQNVEERGFLVSWIDDQMKYEPVNFGSSFRVLTTLFWIADDVWGRQWVWCLAQKMVGSSGEQTLLLEISRWGNKKGQTTTQNIRHSEPQWINIGILISDLKGEKTV